MSDVWTPVDTARHKRGLIKRKSRVRVVLALIVAAATIFFLAAPVAWIFWASLKPGLRKNLWVENRQFAG